MVCLIHVCTSEAIHQQEMTIKYPVTISSHIPLLVCLPTPLQGEATPVSVCCGSLSVRSKCCFYFLPVTPICQGHAKAISQLPYPQWSPLNVTWTCLPVVGLFFSFLPEMTVCGLQNSQCDILFFQTVYPQYFRFSWSQLYHCSIIDTQTHHWPWHATVQWMHCVPVI